MTSESSTSDLRIAVQEPASWSRRLSITVPVERVKRTRSRVASQIASNVRLPGFRKGRTPASFIEKRFAADIQQETIDRLIQETYREALEREGLNPIAQGKVERIEYAEGTELTYEVELEVQPAIALERVEGFVVGLPTVEVGDEDVEREVERLRAQRGHTHPLAEGETPSDGDEVTVEVTPLDPPPAAEGEEPAAPEASVFRIPLGQGQAIPDIEAAIRTLTAGQAGEFTVRYPDDFPDAAQAGVEQRLSIRLVEGARRHLPDADDALAASVGFETMDALRADIRRQLDEGARRQGEEQVRAGLIERIAEANPFDVPPSMTERWLDWMTGDAPDEQGRRRPRTAEQAERISQLRELFRPQADAAVRRMLIIQALAAREGLAATSEDVDARVEALAAEHGRSESDVWLELERSGQMSGLESEILEEKVFAWLRARNTIA